MDPVSVFTALYDAKFVSFDSKQGPAELPYNIDMRRLSLYPKLMNAIVSQVTEKYLTTRFLQAQDAAATTTLTTAKSVSSSPSTKKSESPKEQEASGKNLSGSEESDADSHFDEELEVSSSEESDNHLDNQPDLRLPIICSATNRSSTQLATAIAFKAKLPYLFNENQQPDLELIEALDIGSLKAAVKAQDHLPKRRVILIEDVVSSSEKTLELIRKLEQSQKFEVQFVVCVVDCDRNEINRLEQQGIRVMSLYNMEAILRILEITGRITTDHYSQTIQCIARLQNMAITQTPNKCPARAQPLVAPSTLPKANIKVAAI